MSRMGGPPQQMQTYRLGNRREPRSRLAACGEVGCEAHIHGWRTQLDPADPQTGARVAYIRNDSGRHFGEWIGDDGSIAFDFPAGQQCFAEHWTEVKTLYVVRDYRKGHAAGSAWRKHTSPDSWVDEFATNQDKLAAVVARG